MRNEWLRILRREASAHHMCEENRTALGQIETKQDAIWLYKRTIDWALEEKYPALETIREHFSDCEIDGIFVDRHFDGEILNDQQVYVFHHCSGTIRIGLNVQKHIIPMLYFANGCDMTIKGIENSKMAVGVPLYIFGENRISAEQSDDIICIIRKKETK